jgi:iron complex outermembrane receptor protein
MKYYDLIYLITILTIFPLTTIAENDDDIDYTQLDIEELLTIQLVTSVTSQEQQLSESAAAIFVITQEDLLRTGVSNLAEALRMVPGVQVSQANANHWAVTIRGFNNHNPNKLLVLVDGRSVYSPLFDGVLWEMQDILLEDINRIEVIRGPGSALWGANAVNGVINIITQPASKTQNTLLSFRTGYNDRLVVGLRHGGKVGKNGHYRVYGKYFQHDDFRNALGKEVHDHWQTVRGGFRLDLPMTNQDEVTLQGDIYGGDLGQGKIDQSEDVYGNYLLAQWTRKLSPTSNTSLKLYYDQLQRDNSLSERTQTAYDLELLHNFMLTAKHTLTWGLGIRHLQERENFLTLLGEERDNTLYSAFIQDSFELLPKTLTLTLGSKFERNTITGFEIQPTARLLYQPHQHHIFWFALSRAVHTPSVSRSSHLANQQENAYFNHTDLNAETLYAQEIGYRFLPNAKLSIDSTLFYNRYENLLTVEPISNSNTYRHDNQMEGYTYGLEIVSTWQATPAWRLSGSYSYLDMELHLKPTSRDTFSELAEGNIPHHQISLRSLFNFTPRTDLDIAVYYRSKQPNQQVKNYLRLDILIDWHIDTHLEFSMGVQNILDNQHPEFNNDSLSTSEVEQEFYGQVRWNF